MSFEFKCRMADQMQAFLNQKHNAGFDYKSRSYVLRGFDLMLSAAYPEAVSVTHDMLEDWVDARSDHPQSLPNEISVIRQFCLFLDSIGIISYIPPSGFVKGPVHYEPHLFTDEEIVALFAAIDSTPWSEGSPTKYYIAPIAFRLFYSCGLRESEVRKLSREDVDLETGRILIRQSKQWKERVIYVNSDMLANLQEYDNVMRRFCPGREAFFPKRSGMFFKSGIFTQWFRQYWNNLPEAKSVVGNRPRLHDLRHHFFTERLNQWSKEGEDIAALQLYLSEFGGHANYIEDDYYEHLSASYFPEMKKRLSEVDQNILPEVTHE